jgi:hypothetical protein
VAQVPNNSRSRSLSPTRRTRVVEQVTRSIVEEEEEEEEDTGDEEDGHSAVVAPSFPAPSSCCHYYCSCCSCRPASPPARVPAALPAAAPRPLPAAKEQGTGNGDVVMDSLETLADAAFAACERSVPSPDGFRVGAAVLCQGGVIVSGHAASSPGPSALCAALTEAMDRGETKQNGCLGFTFAFT